MFDTDKWQEVWLTLRRNKLRTIMTASGVFWGIFMLVLMLGFGNGLQAGVNRNMIGFSSNAVFIWAQRTSLPHRGFQPGRYIPLHNRDIEVLQRQVPDIEHLAPRVQLGGWREGINVTYAEKTGNFGVMGDTPALAHIEPLKFIYGRFINELDMSDRRKVAVIGEQIYQVLMSGSGNPVGRYIKVRGVHFQVVGLFRSEQPGEQGDRLKSTIFIPFSTFQHAFNQINRIGWFAMTARADVDAATVEAEARRALSTAHGVHPDDAQAFGSYNSAETFGKVHGLFTGIRFFIWFVGVITLLAGVLGVSNIMLIIVKERTREFGIRKAIGATPSSIISLVIQESVTLTAVAGYAGLVAGVGFLELCATAFGDDNTVLGRPEIEFDIALIALGVLIVSGVVAGLVPARHAAKINPVVALRAE